MTDEELRFLEMFPEVWYVDVTGQTNNEKIQLLVLAGKDGMHHGFTGLRVFLPNDKTRFLIGSSMTVLFNYYVHIWLREMSLLSLMVMNICTDHYVLLIQLIFFHGTCAIISIAFFISWHSLGCWSLVVFGGKNSNQIPILRTLYYAVGTIYAEKVTACENLVLCTYRRNHTIVPDDQHVKSSWFIQNMMN